MKEFNVENHESSYLPDNKKWKLIWSDEFDGTSLDTSKWDYRLCMMGRRHEAWTDKGVSLDGKGNVVFKLLLEDGMPRSSQLQTGYNFMDEPVVETKFAQEALQWPIGKLKENKFTHSHGYYECRCKLQQKDGWWSAFWIQSPVIGASLDPADTGVEIDIMESIPAGNIFPHNVFTGGYGLDMQWLKVGGDVKLNKEEFHRFGLLWDETGYTFYIDGKEDGHIDTCVTSRPEFILISTEPKGYRNDDHKPIKEAYESVGDEFIVDYVRVFDEVK